MKKDWWFGKSCSVDLHGCDINLITNPIAIKRYTRELCKLINMKPHGPCRVEKFGVGRLRGYSMMQFIQTSSITAHFDDTRGRAFIDIFSCRQFNPKKAAAFSKRHFKAKRSSLRIKERI